jgi:hypothetical protein
LVENYQYISEKEDVEIKGGRGRERGGRRGQQQVATMYGV